MVMEAQQGRSFTHGGGRGLDRLRKRCFPGGRELTGKIGCIIRPCWVPTHFHQVLTTGQTGPSCLTEKEAESWVKWGVYHSPSRGTWEVTLFWDSPALAVSALSACTPSCFRLTAFVLKSFAQARSFIFIDPLELEAAKDWIVQQQQADGSFPAVGRILNKDIQVSSFSASSGSPGLVLLAPRVCLRPVGLGGCPLWLG